MASRLPSIPQYYMDYINKNVDLTTSPKQCCPFHQEDTPSWSYSADKKRWRCFGKCHTGGDVVELHRCNYKLASKEEALKSLKRLYNIQDNATLNDAYSDVEVRKAVVEQEVLYQRVIQLAGADVDRWLQLDYVMSKYPLDCLLLEELILKWTVV